MSKSLWIITGKTGGNSEVFRRLSVAANDRDIAVKELPATIDLSRLPSLAPGDLVYVASTKFTAEVLFRLIYRPDLGTVYSSADSAMMPSDNVVAASLRHYKAGLPIIPTIFDIPNDATLMLKYVEALGGFPVILKIQGMSHGEGVRQCDDLESLQRVAMSLNDSTRAILRKFVPHKQSARLIVVGDRVVASATYFNTASDIRTSAGKNPQLVADSFSTEIEEVAVKATKTIGVEFGGVDVLVPSDGSEPLLAEVNTPCYFPRVQSATGIDIAGEIIDYLNQKSNTQAFGAGE